MAPPFERGLEEGVDQPYGLVVRDEAGGQHQHVGVVVQADQLGHLGNPAESRANPLVFVEGHGHPFARAAEADAEVDLALFDRFGERVGVVGVVDALGRVGAEIEDLAPFGLEVAHQKFLHFVAGVVAGDTDFFHLMRVLRCFRGAYPKYRSATLIRNPTSTALSSIGTGRLSLPEPTIAAGTAIMSAKPMPSAHQGR